LNKIYEAFDEIHASDELKKKTLSYCTERKRIHFMPQAIAACITAAAVLGGAGVFHATTTEAAYISLDINPSIGLSLNQFKRVISADAYNSEAQAIIDSLDLKWKNYSDAVDAILTSEAMQGYDTSDAQIYIESDSDSLNQEINDTISEKCPDAGLYCHNGENREEAQKYNISPGKYYLIEQIIQYGGTIDDYKDKSMQELIEIYTEYSGGELPENMNGQTYGSGSGHDGHGSGTGNGQGTGNGTGAGNGAGTGSGTGAGNGTGAGSGSGTGQGTGNGAGTGSGTGTGNGTGKGAGNGGGGHGNHHSQQ
jgi:hypothetical protein